MIKRILFRILAFFLALTLSSALFLYFGPTGSLIVQPLLRRWGASNVPTLKLEAAGGNLRSGIALNGISLVSGDRTFVRAGTVVLRPAWRELIRGKVGLSLLEIEGVSADLADLKTLAAHYGGQKESRSEGIEPLRLRLRDITLETPLYPIKLDEGILSQTGELSASVDLGGVPLLIEGALAFDPFAARSLDVRLGEGRASLKGSLSAPFDLEGELAGLDLGELLALVSPLEGGGTIDGRFRVKGSEPDLRAWGFLELSRGNVLGVPLRARVPWNYFGGDLVASQVQVESLSADIVLKLSADLRPVPLTDRFLVRGSVANISMPNLGRALSLDMKLEGEDGRVDFWVSADQRGNRAGKAFIRLPKLNAAGKPLVRDLRTSVFFEPENPPRLEGSGSLFGARLRAEGKVLKREGLRPVMALTAEGLDTALLGTAFPAFGSLAPSGLLNLSIALDENLAVEGGLDSPRLTLGGTVLTNLIGSIRYAGGKVILEDFRGRLGRAAFDIAGNADLRSNTLDFNGSAIGLDPRSIPALSGSFEGAADVRLGVRGTLSSPQVSIAVSGNENRLAGLPVRRLSLSGTYADRRVTLPETVLLVPGGSLAFRGHVDLPEGAAPRLDLSGTLSNLDLQTLGKNLNADLSGRLEGKLSVSGEAQNAALSASLRSDKIRVASADIRSLRLEFSGTTQRATVRSLSATVNDGAIEGQGSFGFARNDKMKVDMKVIGLDIRAFLEDLGVEGVVGGQLNGSLSLQGTPARPELALKVTSPLTIRETLVDHLAVTVISPSKGQLDINASGSLGDLKVTLKGAMKRAKEGWSYALRTDSMDVNRLVTAKMPSMRDRLGGTVDVQVKGNLGGGNGKETAPIDVTVKFPSLSTAGVTVRELLVPIEVRGRNAAIRKGTGGLYGGKILLSADIALDEQRWQGNARVLGLDIGKAAGAFLKEGALVGSADLNVNLRGNFGTLMMVFANGDFSVGEGYIHEFKALERIAKNGRVSFQEIRGSFFWDGRDLWLNPGTQARATPDEPLYRYFAANGPLGIPGKGLALNCQGRFDVRILDSILGALKGAFQLMTGSLTGGTQLVRQTVSKMIGFNERDFQEVSFQLRGSWSELQLLNLKIDKSLEGFFPKELPARRKDEERKLQLNLRIPTGAGGGNNSQDAGDQIKKQLLDNLLNQLQY